MSRITHYFLLLFYLILYLTYDSVSKSLRKMPVIEANFTNDDITETQHTICKIATEDVIANAHATTVLTKSKIMDKKLDNVTSDITETQHIICKIAKEDVIANARVTVTVLTDTGKAKIMDEKFASLEDRLIKEFANIKWILNNILEQQSNYLKSIQNANLYDAISDNYLSPRQDEIDKVNNSMQNLPILNGSVKAFIYYWQVKNFNMMLMNWQTGRSMRSSTFYAGQSGYAMYLKITPKYFPDGTVFVGVGLTRGRYDSVLAWPFPYRIRLEVLDHSLEGAREDRRSRIWDPITLCTEDFWGRPRTADNPECVGLSIPRRVILSKSLIITASQRYLGNTRYMWNGSVLIKLVVYL